MNGMSGTGGKSGQENPYQVPFSMVREWDGVYVMLESRSGLGSHTSWESDLTKFFSLYWG